MSNEKQVIIVPWDFTKIAEYALEHAIILAKKANNNIALLHIVDDKTSHKTKVKGIRDAVTKIEKIGETVYDKHRIKVLPIVRKGTIFTTINEVAAEIDADLLVMGTHGIKGMQRLTGSWALKVIAGSMVPFVVIQKKPPEIVNKEYKIVFPLDFKSENIEKLRWASYLSTQYKSKIYIFNKHYTETALVKKLESKLVSARRYLNSNKINYEIQTANKKGKFQEQIIEYAKEIEADIILITTTKALNMADYVLGAPEQAVIANPYKIPVMCVNPSKISNLKFKPYM